MCNIELTLQQQQKSLNKLLSNIQEINSSLDNTSNMIEQIKCEYKQKNDCLVLAKKKGILFLLFIFLQLSGIYYHFEFR